MRLTSQNLPEIEDVTVTDLDRAFDGCAIGKFVHLWSSDDCFIQAGRNGTPSKCVHPDASEVKEHWTFIHRSGSEPWTLERIDSSVRRQGQQAVEWLTLEQVKRAFVGFLQGDPDWHRGLTWVDLKM
jgi:hypothetical protein